MMFGRFKPASASSSGTMPSIPAGKRAYAIGDVHGRLDLLDAMLNSIERDASARGAAENHVVVLGDLIDRGPNSRGVIERLRTFKASWARLIVLMGNHEEVLLRVLAREHGILDSWLKFGGTQTLKSYGGDPEDLQAASEGEAMELIRRAIPLEHQLFLDELADTVKIGDYLFVHAGIRPSVDLSMQVQADLRWIRQEFLHNQTDHGFIVVHGHTISDEIVERSNRIGIDTGAYATGRLSAVGLEGSNRWFLEATSSS